MSLHRAHEVTGKPVQWLIPDLLPASAVTGLVGVPESGKSLLAAMLAARITQDIKRPRTLGKAVLWLCREEDQQTVVVPRLKAAGCNLKKILLPNVSTRWPCLPDNLDSVQEIVRKEDIRLILCDPIQSYLADHVDSNHAQSVRAVMEGLTFIATTTGCSFLVVMHLRKDRTGSPLDWVAGSGAWVQTCRVVAHIHKRWDSDDRVLSFAKFSLGKRPSSTLLQIRTNGNGAHMVDQGFVSDSAEDSEAPLNGSGQLEREEGINWLRNYLAVRKEVKAAYSTWQQQGFSRTEWWRARKSLNVTIEREGSSSEGQHTYLTIPGHTQKDGTV